MTGNPLPYDLGEMKTEDGHPLRYQINRRSIEVAVQMAQSVAQTGPYRDLAFIFPPGDVALYFEKRIRMVIYPVIRDLCVQEWRLRTSGNIERPIVCWPNHRGLGALLLDLWPSPLIPLSLASPPNGTSRIAPAASIINSLVESFKRLSSWLDRPSERRRSGVSAPLPRMKFPSVAFHYTEGLDLACRSDLFWFPDSGIDPARILIYFDPLRWSVKDKIPIETIRRIEGLGMKWVCLEDGRIVDHNHPPVWASPKTDRPFLSKFLELQGKRGPCADPMTQWSERAAEYLLSEVDYWHAFYREFNVRVEVVVDETGCRNVAQKIALGRSDGINIGKQRSIFFGLEGGNLGFNPNHVFFVWGHMTLSGLSLHRNRIEHALVAGYPNDAAMRLNVDKSRQIRAGLMQGAVRFVLALFDNNFNREIYYSKEMMETFYRTFLEWVIDDPEVALVIKPKQPENLEIMPQIHGLIEHAKKLGRCVILKNSFGRLPSDASQAADMSVGIGISTPIVEAVLAGGRGIHLDLTRHRSHPFYSWGYDKVIFDDPARCVTAIRQYLSDPLSHPDLGDFSCVLDQIDPFRDGRAGERVGMYIRWLLELLEEGNCRNDALRQANIRYRAAYGLDTGLGPGQAHFPQ